MWLSILLAATLFTSAPSRATTGSCLKYGPDTVRVTGKLARHTYSGAPNFGEDPKRDARETGFYLDLAEPVCALAGKNAGFEGKAGVTRIQLVLDQRGYARLRPRLGSMVSLRGRLFGASTGHHHAPLVLEVLEPVAPK